MSNPERSTRRCRFARIGKVLFCVGWLLVLVLAARAVATARDTSPEQLLGLLPTCYLAAWGPFFLFSRQGPASKVARFLVCTFSILLTIGVLELPAIFHLVDYRAIFATPTPAWRRPGNLPDPELIFVRQGHQRTRLRFRGADLSRMRGVPGVAIYDCDLQLDQHGFRNPVDRTAANTIVIGDSFIEGLHVAPTELISARLADLLGSSVVNLGRTGYGPQQELHVLRRYGLGLRPRTCIWAFYEGNDLQDVGAYETDRKHVLRTTREGSSKDLYSRCLARNALAFLIRNWFRPEPSRPVGLYTGRFVDGAGQASDLRFSCGVHEGDALPATPRGESVELRRVQAILSEAHSLCKRQGIDLIVLFVPAKFRIYRDLCSFDPHSPCLNWGVDSLPEALRTAISTVSGEIGFLDLTARFRAEAAGGSLLYLADDTHWSAEGHRLAAVALAELLAARRPSEGAESLTER